MAISRPSARFGRPRRRGAITVFFCCALMAFMGMLALTVDVGYYYTRKAWLQSIADTALLASYAQVDPRTSQEEQRASLTDLLRRLEASNGLDAALLPADVRASREGPGFFALQVRTDPATETVARVELEGTAEFPTYFARLFNQETIRVGIVSAAEGKPLHRPSRSLMQVHLVQ